MPDVPSIRQVLIDQIASEERATGATLERVPQERWDWVPHEKSMALGRLARWVAVSLGGVPGVLTETSMDLASDDGFPPVPASASELVPTFEAAASTAREALAATPDSAMGELMSVKAGDQVVWGSVPRYVVVESFFLADLIHHRAQLGVYLRLLGLPVPAVYGPSADEQA